MLTIAYNVKQEKVHLHLYKYLLFYSYIVCQHSCHKVVSHYSNNTECVMVWANYHDKYKEIISWDGVSTMPMCSSECKRWIDELDSNPIGKYLKCCSCNEQEESKE